MKQEHANKTDDPLLEEQAHPLSGMSWKFISQCVTRGDFKGRKRGMAKQHALTAAKKMGITLEEAQQRHGKKTTAR
jgi:hypothetical protein